MNQFQLGPISPFPLWKEIPTYRWPTFRADLLAALSVALLALPQAMAYAFVAELPASAGIFAAIFGTIFTSAFGSSALVVSGPTNTIAILIQSGTAEILYRFYPEVSGANRDDAALLIVLQICLIVGILQILGGVFRLGRVTQFASRPVVLGYLAGAAAAITITQLYYFLGIREEEGSFPLYHLGWYLIEHLYQMHLPTALIGVGCLILLIFFHRLSQKIPGPVIVFVLSALVVFYFNLSPPEKLQMYQVAPGHHLQKVSLLEEFGPITLDLPTFLPPVFDLKIVLKVIPLAFAIALLSALEVTSLGRTYSAPQEPHFSDNQEIYGLGVSNFLSSFLGAMPSSGSFSRTALNVSSGGKTRLSSIYSGLLLIVIGIVLGFAVTQIPLPAISALMLLTAFTMVNFQQLFSCLKSTWSDAFVVLATFFAAFFVSLDVALYIGIVLSVALYLKKAGLPYFIEYTFNNVGKLRPMESFDVRPDPRICILQAEGELFFGAAEPLQEKIREISEDESIRVIILQMLNARHIDASVSLTLESILTFLQTKDCYLLISGATLPVEDVLTRSGFKEKLGEQYFFPANEKIPSEPTRSAYAFAKILLN